MIDLFIIPGGPHAPLGQAPSPSQGPPGSMLSQMQPYPPQGPPPSNSDSPWEQVIPPQSLLESELYNY